jgi:pimeloyl-ACP methyl ester carboxylesterase
MPYLDRDDARIWWDSSGHGPAVLLLNGLGSPAATWFRLQRQLISRFRVVTVDNRGVGKTGAPRGDCTIEAMAADAAAVLAEAGEPTAHVLGMSMGGLIAQELAVSRPDLVRSLVLACTHVGIPHAAALGQDGLPEPGVPEALAGGTELTAAERMARIRPFLYAAGTSEKRIAEDEAVRDAQPTSAEAFAAQLIGASTWERLAELPDVAVPTLVLQGSEDRMVPRQQAQRLADAIPGARLLLVEGAGHALFTDQEEECGAAIVDFWKQVEARTPAVIGRGSR